MTKKIIRIGTRGSQLALWQANAVATALREAYPALDTQIVTIKTAGDWKPEHGETALSAQAGGKGLFVKEIEAALLEGTIDIGVHSAKDVPSFLPAGLAVDHVLPGEDPHDVLISATGQTLDDLPAGTVVGTSSLRRQAFILYRRPDLKVVTLRGNVPTRLKKLRDGQVGALVLACAGLKRLNMTDEITARLDSAIMLPAAGQGVIAIETRAADMATGERLRAIHCQKTGWRLAAERAALQALNGSCRTPIGAYAVYDGGALSLTVIVAEPDGSAVFTDQARAPVADTGAAAELGRQCGARVKEKTPPALLAKLAGEP